MLASRRGTEGESSTASANEKIKPKLKNFGFLAGAEGLEPTTHGFGDQYSTN